MLDANRAEGSRSNPGNLHDADADARGAPKREGLDLVLNLESNGSSKC